MADKKKILIIEDEALVARELKARLGNMGYEVVGVALDAAAIELARKTQPDLLLTDIHLKAGEDGIRVARVIQAERDVPVVFLTAYSDEETVTRAKAVAPYGYIIKPVENRELEIAIEIALYKFNIERELKATQLLLQTALSCIGSALIFVGADGAVTDLNADGRRLLGLPIDAGVGRQWVELFSLRSGSPVSQRIDSALQGQEITRLAPFIVTCEAGSRLVDGIVGPMDAGAVLILRELSEIHDPIEMLPSAEEMLANVGPDRLAPSESSLCQLLIAAEAPQHMIEQVTDEVATSLNHMLRATDLVSAYGDRQLAVSMPYTSVSVGQRIADSILKSLRELQFGDHRVSFSIGLSATVPGDQQPFELFRRASWALKVARESGGDRVISWKDHSDQPTAPRDRDRESREYHNLVLLWNVMNVVVKSADKEALAEKLCLHLQQSFTFRCVAILDCVNDTISAITGVLAGKANFHGVGDLGLTERDFHAVRQLLLDQGPAAHHHNRHLFALSGTAVLFVDASDSIPPADVQFLQTLVSYCATGFATHDVPDRVSQVAELDDVLYQSPRMAAVAESVRQVAPTDATVLIIGESGTGKERIARSIHNASGRRTQPFTIIDCGAVAASLIESELFGHMRGAFTGADRHFPGRLKEAAGGTVLLDEVGELPLQVQVKLLRFVQERQIVPVGSSRVESVDTRVIAATHRDLKAMIGAGLFREDLYYRLNVFRIEMPSLEDRVEDILLIARHYLAVYAEQYGKPITAFTAEAERGLLRRAWPGNIRELMNVINRAVILCRDSTVNHIHLGIFDEAPGAALKVGDLMVFETWLRRQVDASLSNHELPPLGQYLEEDLIMATLADSDEIMNRAALTLGLPETTLRRKVARLREMGHAPGRLGESISPLIAQVVEVARDRRQSVLDLVSATLMAELEARRLNRRDAAALLGVSMPTYRKMLDDSPFFSK